MFQGGFPKRNSSTNSGTAVPGRVADGLNFAGDFRQESLSAASALALATGVPLSIVSMLLPAGQWFVAGVLCYTFGATTNVVYLAQGIGLASAVLPAQDSISAIENAATGIVPTNANDQSFIAPSARFYFPAPTFVYLVAKATFSISTLSAYGKLTASRAP